MKHAGQQTLVGQRSSEAGFTLVEALTAIVILVFGLVAVTNLLIVAGTSSQVANAGTAAAAIAAEQMEILKATSFLNLVPGPALTDPDTDVAGYFRNSTTDPRLRIPGAGVVSVHWAIAQVDPRLLHITVRAEVAGTLLGRRTRAEFTTLRACTNPQPTSGVCAPADIPCCP